MNNERLRILQLIESGQISVDEGVRRLERLAGDQTPGSADDPETSALASEEGRPPAGFPVSGFVRVAWQIVFGVGIVVVGAGGLLLARAYSREGMPGHTWGWVLFVLGLLVLLLGWWLRRARWFYVRVREHDGTPFTIALPLPLGLVLALSRVARPFAPQLRGLEMDELILAVEDELRQGRPFSVNVEEGEDGDRVEVHVC